MSAITPARRAAYEVVRRVFEHEAYADRAFATAARGLDERDRSLAQQIAFGTVQRARALDHGIETLGRRPVRKLDPPVLAALRIGAYQLGVSRRRSRPRGCERERRARAPRASGTRRPFTNACCGAFRRACGNCSTRCRRAAQAVVPGLDRRDLGARLRAEQAIALMRAQNDPPETDGAPRARRGGRRADRRAGRAPRRPGGRRCARRRPHLAAEPRLGARRARGGLP